MLDTIGWGESYRGIELDPNKRNITFQAVIDVPFPENIAVDVVVPIAIFKGKNKREIYEILLKSAQEAINDSLEWEFDDDSEKVISLLDNLK